MVAPENGIIIQTCMKAQSKELQVASNQINKKQIIK